MTCRRTLPWLLLSVAMAAGTLAVAVPVPARADAIAEQEIYVLARQAFESGRYEEAIEKCTNLLALNPDHAEGKALLAKATRARDRRDSASRLRASTARWGERYEEFSKRPQGLRVGIEYVLRPRDVYRVASALNLDPRQVGSAVHEVRFILGGRWTVAKYLLLGTGLLPSFNIASSGGGWGIVGRLLVGVPIIPFSDRYGLKAHITVDWGYRRTRLTSDGVTYELQPWYRQVDYGFQMAVQLNRFNLLLGGGVNMNGQPLAMFGVEGF